MNSFPSFYKIKICMLIKCLIEITCTYALSSLRTGRMLMKLYHITKLDRIRLIIILSHIIQSHNLFPLNNSHDANIRNTSAILNSSSNSIKEMDLVKKCTKHHFNNVSITSDRNLSQILIN